MSRRNRFARGAASASRTTRCRSVLSSTRLCHCFPTERSTRNNSRKGPVRFETNLPQLWAKTLLGYRPAQMLHEIAHRHLYTIRLSRRMVWRIRNDQRVEGLVGVNECLEQPIGRLQRHYFVDPSVDEQQFATQPVRQS